MLEFKSLAARAYPICKLDNLFYSWRMLVHPEPSLLTLVHQVESKWNTCKYRWKILLKLQFILFIKLCFFLLFVWLCTLRGCMNLLKKQYFMDWLSNFDFRLEKLLNFISSDMIVVHRFPKCLIMATKLVAVWSALYIVRALTLYSTPITRELRKPVLLFSSAS